MAAPQLLAIATLGQPSDGVLADRLQHPEAWLAAGQGLRPDEAVVQQRLDAGDHIELEVAGDGLRAVQREAPDKDAEAREERLLLRAEEVVAPLDRCAQRPVPRGHAGTRLGLQDVESHAEALEDVARREQLDSSGGEFECQREPVQADAELGDSVCVELGELEVGSHVACASDKEPYRLRASEAVDLEWARQVGKLERGDGVDPLLGDVERRAAGDEKRQAGRIREQLAEHRRRVEHAARSCRAPRAPAGRAAMRSAFRAIRVPAARPGRAL